MNDFPALSIVGPGRVGTAIGVLAAEAAWPVIAIGGRDRDKTSQAARRIGERVRACSMVEAARYGHLVLITVSDDAIEPVCNNIARQNGFNSNSIVVHCSGALSSDILSSARDSCRCLVASMHPLQTFATVDSACAKLKGTYCFCEGDKEGLPVIEGLAKRIGIIPVHIHSSSKVLYHAAAVFACNYLVTLMDAAIETANLAKIDHLTAWSAFAPLVVSTIENISEIGPDRALTGPISRGDIRTIAQHIEKLESVEPSLASMYRAMARHAVDIALRNSSITEEKAEEIKRVLKFCGKQE
ncbi:MAG: DUF2520 domain-containing protein [Phycisphaerae bacterium]|nr:DUF2520 domain-containing protein [Phycisphaerae bacterium]